MSNDEAIKCVEIAEQAMAKGDYEKAKKLLTKSLNMSPTEKAKKLLAECEAASSGPQSTKSSPQKDYSDEDAKLASDIVRKTDYYDILGVAKTASEDEIKKQYKKLALKLHPDKNHAPQATEAFKKLSQACTCLTDKNKRQMYDIQGSEENLRQQYRQQYQGAEEEIDPEDIFDLLFSGRINPNRRRRRFNGGVGGMRFFGGGLNAEHFFGRVDEDGEVNHNRRRVSRLMQFLPLLILLALAFLMQYKELASWSSPKDYSFTESKPYVYSKNTLRANVQYYVTEDFNLKYGKDATALERLEDNIENDYLELLWKQCGYMRYLKGNLEERKYYARKDEKARLAQEIKSLDMSACDQFTKIKKLKSGIA